MANSKCDSKKSILAIGAHFDDVELGCGGSLLNWKLKGHDITVFIVTKSGYSDPDGKVIRRDIIARKEGQSAANFIGANLIEGGFQTFEVEFSEPLNCKIMEILDIVKPDIVLTHWHGDVHHDHRVIALASMHCCRHVARLLMYCSNLYESESVFNPRFFVDITSVFQEKLKLAEIFRSELTRTGELWVDLIRSRSRMMGIKSGVKYAESFEVVKWVE